MLESLKKDLKKSKNNKKAKVFQKFFKTKKGEYGAGDLFLGLTSQQINKVILKYYEQLTLTELKKLLDSKIHEFRMAAVKILVLKYKNAKQKQKEEIVKFYIKYSTFINNWDLVDISADKILGDYLLTKTNRQILYNLASTKNLWQKRIAIVSTLAFIRTYDFFDTLQICKILMKDKHDLINKACGWMLREVGKRDNKILEKFLKDNILNINRTTLRYAIEKFPKNKRKYYLKLKI